MNEDRAWIAHGSDTAEHEDFLIGNRAGLQQLKSAIERALTDGQSTLETPGMEFIGVRVVESDPRKPVEPMTLKNKIWFSLAILFLAFLVFSCSLSAFTH